MSTIVKINQLDIGNTRPLTLIAGPCQIESRDHAFEMCGALKELTQNIGLPFIYKAPMTRQTGRPCPAGGALAWTGDCRFYLISENILASLSSRMYMAPSNAPQSGKPLTCSRFRPFCARQTDLLVAAAQTGKVVNIKKGQFLAPWDMEHVARKVADSGNRNIMLCERGASFGYNTLVSDMRSLPVMQRTGYPVIFDATHSVQQPGGLGGASGGDRDMVPVLARAAVAVGVAGVFIETHQDPDNAPSDGPNMVKLSDLPALLEILENLIKLQKCSIIKL